MDRRRQQSITRLKHKGFIGVAAICLVAVSACGGGSDSDDSSKGTHSDTSAEKTARILKSVKADSALEQMLPTTVQSAGTLTVGSPMKAAPSNFYAKDGKTATGYEVDLSRAIAQKLGLKVRHEAMAFNTLITSLETKRIDMTMAAMNDTAERQQKIDFVDYLTSGIVFTVQAGNPKKVAGPMTLCGKTVTVGLGTTQESYSQALSKKCTTAGKSAIKIDVDNELSQRVNSLRTGRSDALVMDLGGAVYTAETAGGGTYFDIIEQPLINGEPYGIGFNKDNLQLRNAVAKALQSLMDDGTYLEILTAWGVEKGAIKQAVVNGA